RTFELVGESSPLFVLRPRVQHRELTPPRVSVGEQALRLTLEVVELDRRKVIDPLSAAPHLQTELRVFEIAGDEVLGQTADLRIESAADRQESARYCLHFA